MIMGGCGSPHRSAQGWPPEGLLPRLACVQGWDKLSSGNFLRKFGTRLAPGRQRSQCVAHRQVSSGNICEFRYLIVVYLLLDTMQLDTAWSHARRQNAILRCNAKTRTPFFVGLCFVGMDCYHFSMLCESSHSLARPPPPQLGGRPVRKN